MKKFFWLILFACVSVLSVYLIHNMNSNGLFNPNWWKTATVEKVQKEIENIKNDTDINSRDHEDGKTPLMFAAEFNENPEIIKILIGAGADVNARDKKNRTALMFAASNNYNIEIVKTLIMSGADVNAKDKDGKTALTYAEKIGNSAIAKVIIAAESE